jgi:hypothetical protein
MAQILLQRDQLAEHQCYIAYQLTVAGFLRGVIILVSERGILIHNDPLEICQQTQGGVFLSHPHKSSLID